MGNTQSAKSFNREQVNDLLKQQREAYDQRIAELVSTATNEQRKNVAAAQQTAKEEARKEIDRLMKEKQEQLSRLNAQLNNAVRTQPTTTQIPTSTSSLERNRTQTTSAVPAHKNATVAVSPATATGQISRETNLYPGLKKTASPIAASAPLGPQTAPPIRMQTTRPQPIRESAPQSRDSNNIPPLMNVPVENSFVFVDRPRNCRPSTPSAPSASGDRVFYRSSSRSRNDPGDVDELNCPTHKNRFGGQTRRGRRGHSPRSQPMKDMKVQCPNMEDGCRLSFKLVEIGEHVKECPFGEMICPLNSIFGQCTWRGKMPQLVGHFDNQHQMHRQGNVDSEMILLNLTHENHIMYLVTIGSYNFLFRVKVSQQHECLYIAVLLLGTRQSASKWSYEVNIYNKREPRRKFQYIDVCRSNIESMDDLVANAECTTIPLEYARTFMSDGCLTYKFYIRRNDDEKNDVKSNQRGRGGARRRF